LAVIDLGIIKVDLLGLGMTAPRQARRIVGRRIESPARISLLRGAYTNSWVGNSESAGLTGHVDHTGNRRCGFLLGEDCRWHCQHSQHSEVDEML
jgi:hypothetical protein